MPEGPPLEGIRVLDLATIYAGPLTAMLLGDYGADVIKIEHPRGDPLRTHGASKDGIGLWWKMLSRNKRTVTLNLSAPGARDVLLNLVRNADVLIENFRPGVMERWGVGWSDLSTANKRLIMLRTTGFGQFGPYASRPAFGTLAEAMSGFASMTGEPDGPPTLPPFGLADGIAGVMGAYAVMLALYKRDQTERGQMIDLAILEPILMVLGPQPLYYDQLGHIPPRMGNRSTSNAPRNTYRTRDGRWVAISTSANSIADRVMRLVGHPEVIDEPWFAAGSERVKHADQLDEMVGAWIALRDRDEILTEFEAAGAAIAPIYDIADIMADPQLAALGTMITVPDDELGPVRMQGVPFRMSETPGAIRFTGRRIGQDNDRVYAEAGLDPAALRAAGIIP